MMANLLKGQTNEMLARDKPFEIVSNAVPTSIGLQLKGYQMQKLIETGTKAPFAITRYYQTA